MSQAPAPVSLKNFGEQAAESEPKENLEVEEKKLLSGSIQEQAF